MRKIATLVLLMVPFLGACSAKIPISQDRFDIPEAVGAHNLTVSVGVAPQFYELELSPNYTTTMVNTTNPNILIGPKTLSDSISIFAFDVGYGVNDNFEIGVSSSKLQAVYFKYQLVGKPQSQAKKGNFSLAIIVAPLFAMHGDVQSVTTSYDYSSAGVDLSALIGYRTADWVLVYGGSYFSKSHYAGTVRGGPVIPSYAYSGNYSTQGVTLGAHFNLNKRLYLSIERIWSQLHAGTSSYGNIFWGIRMGYRW